MRLLLTGATGLAGGEVFRQALANDGVTQLTVLTRKPTGAKSAKLKEVLISDFSNVAATELKDFDACIWCLGISQNAVPKDEYIKITYD